MASNDFPLKKRITKEVLNELIPIAEDCVLSYLSETPKPKSDQIEAAFLSGLIAFLSTLRNGGHQDDAYRVAISTCKSLPHAVEAANIVADRIRSPVKKLNTTLNTATELIKRAGLSTLTGFPEDIRNVIGQDIESVLRLFTSLPKESTTKGSGLFGSGVSSFVNHFNTEWLEPSDDDSTTGGSWFSKLLPWNWDFSGLTSNVGSDVGDINNGFNLVEDTPLFTNSTPAITNPVNTLPPSTSTEIPTIAPKTDWSWLSSVIPRYVMDAASTNSMDTTPKTGSELVVKEPPGKIEFTKKPQPEPEWKPNITADDLNGVVTKIANQGFLSKVVSNPLLLGFGLQVAPYIFKYGFPILGSVVGGLADATLVPARDYFKSNDWTDKPTDSGLTKFGHLFARGYKGLAQWHDKAYINPVKKWWNDYDVQKQVSNLGTTIETLLPAFGADYMRYGQQMQQYKAQQAILRQKHEWEEKERKEEIARQNANLLYQNKRERQEALSYNSDIMAEYDNELAYAAELRKHNDRVAEAKKEYIRKLQNYDATERAWEKEKLITEGKFLQRQKYVDAAMSVAKAVGATVSGYFGLAGPATALGTEAAASFGAALQAGGRAERIQREIDRLTAQDHLSEAEAQKLASLPGQYDRESRAAIAASNRGLELQEKALKAETDRNAKVLKAMESGINAAADTANAAIGAMKEGETLELIKSHMPVMAKPYDMSGIESAPVKNPVMKNLKYVPDEMTEDDPRLKKYIEKPFFDTTPKPVFTATNTIAATEQLGKIIAAKENQGKTSSTPTYDLPYVSPLQLYKVNPSSGSSSGTLRTQTVPIVSKPGYIRISPYGRMYSYSKNPPSLPTSSSSSVFKIPKPPKIPRPPSTKRMRRY